MTTPRHTQLGFDFFDAPPSAPNPGPVSPSDAAAGLTLSGPAAVPVTAASSSFGLPEATMQASIPGLATSALVDTTAMASVAETSRPARGRTALRARTGVLFSRLEDLGLRGVDALVLMRTRTVMVSLIGRTLRIHEGYADAPESVLRAIVAFATARTKSDRVAARESILAFDVERGPAVRRAEPPRPGDLAMIAQLTAAHRDLNTTWFGGTLSAIPLRLSGRMATRLGHYDPGSRQTTAEIVLSRTHITRHGWREAMHTLLHEMVHQWQHETGRPLDHGGEFRQKAREVGITPAARRDVMPMEKKRRSAW